MAYQQEIAALDAARFKFIDESGVNLAMTWLYERAPGGKGVVGSLAELWSESDMLAALGSHGVEAV